MKSASDYRHFTHTEASTIMHIHTHVSVEPSNLSHLWFELHTHMHVHTQPLLHLQLAGCWPIKRLIAVQREQAIRPPSEPRTTARAWPAWARPLRCNDGMSHGWVAWQRAHLTDTGVISGMDGEASFTPHAA